MPSPLSVVVAPAQQSQLAAVARVVFQVMEARAHISATTWRRPHSAGLAVGQRLMTTRMLLADVLQSVHSHFLEDVIAPQLAAWATDAAVQALGSGSASATPLADLDISATVSGLVAACDRLVSGVFTGCQLDTDHAPVLAALSDLSVVARDLRTATSEDLDWPTWHALHQRAVQGRASLREASRASGAAKLALRLGEPT